MRYPIESLKEHIYIYMLFFLFNLIIYLIPSFPTTNQGGAYHLQVYTYGVLRGGGGGGGLQGWVCNPRFLTTPYCSKPP